MLSTKQMLGGVFAVVGVSALVGVPGAQARQGADDGVNHHLPIVATNVAISRDKAIEIAQTKLAGTVRRAKLEMEHGVATWKVRIISTDGTKRGDIRVNANTGEVLRVKIKDIHSKSVTKAQKLEAKVEKKKAKLAAKAEKRAAKVERKAERERSNDDSGHRNRGGRN